MLLHLDNETVRLLSALSVLVVGIMYALAWRADPAEAAPKFWAIAFGVGVLVYPVMELGEGTPATSYVIGTIYAAAGASMVHGAILYARWRVRPRVVVSVFAGYWGVVALLLGVAGTPPLWPRFVIDVVAAVVLLILAAAFYRRWRGDRHPGHLAIAAIFAVWGLDRFLPFIDPRRQGDLVFTSVALVGRLSTAALFMFLVQQRMVERLRREAKERQLAEAAARKSERRFESLIELLSDWIWEMDETLRFTYLSPQIYDVSGMPAEFYVGKTRADSHATTDAASGWATLDSKMQAREAFRDLPMRSIHRETGKAIYYQLSGGPIYDSTGRFRGFRGIGRDVTAQTVSRSTVDAILGGVANIVGSDYFEALVSHLARALEMDIVAVAIGTGRGLDLKTQAIWMDGRLADRCECAVTGGPVEALMAGESCEYPAGVARVFPSNRWLRDQKIEGLIGTPLRDNTGRPIGVLLLEKRSPIHNSDITRTVLSALAPRAAAELQRQVADEQVREAERRFRTVVDNMSSGLLVKAGHSYTAANQTVADWTGIPVEEIMRMTDIELFLRMGWGEECREAENAAQRQSIETGEPRLWESTARFGDGRVRDMILTSFPIPGAMGESAANGVLITDVTELRRAEANLQQTQKMEALGRLAGAVAHDFNNIVGAIQGFARFIVEDSPADSTNREHAQRIVSASARAKQLIQQVLTFSRRADIHRLRASVPAAIGDAVALLKVMAPASVHIEIDRHMPAAIIEADVGQIGQVLVNLGVNALDAIEDAPGRIVFSVRRECGAAFDLPGAADSPGETARAVVGAVEPSQSYVVIRVADTGGGMAPDVIERVFEPFFTTKPGGKGTGLGLAVVHGIVLSHQGAIALSSRVGRGTTCDVWLPEAPSVESGSRGRGSEGRGADEPYRILVVDDDVDFGDMLATMMERLGHEVAVATDARDAIATIEQDAAAWDLIVSDQNMPGVSGLDLISQVKRQRPDLPCILCTGAGGGVPQDIARASGVTACLRKPVDRATLVGALEQALGARQR